MLIFAWKLGFLVALAIITFIPGRSSSESQRIIKTEYDRGSYISFPSLSNENFAERDPEPDSSNSLKIIGGEFANPGEFPYQVFIEKIWNSTKIYKCGGAILSYDIVITAAHCLFFREFGQVFAKPRKIWVTAGKRPENLARILVLVSEYIFSLSQELTTLSQQIPKSDDMNK